MTDTLTTDTDAPAGRRRLERRFTTAGIHPYDMVEWQRIDARISNWRDGSVAFEQLGVEFPTTWSQNAVNIVAQKYFRGPLGTPERESSLRQCVDRIVDTYTAWGIDEGYFLDSDEADAFSDELKFILITQRASFNSPVWFNIGVPGVPQQASACFILSIDDTMDSILNWYAEEATIFRGGSGAGLNLSKIRSSHELLSGGGLASGPVSYMRGADASAGTIKSGGKTRRAAKMVILDVDHPDIEEFIWCKAREERKSRVLAAAGFDMGVDGADIISVQYQNANNSVRVTDEFMAAVVADGDWHLIGRLDGKPVRTVRARELFRQIAEAAWECADPGIQFDTTINRWNTAANTDRINGSNPCSEYMHIDNSSCNLASINLLKFLSDDGVFDIASYAHVASVMFFAQDISICRADFPTVAIADNTRKFRQLGLGYANLGALLMALGLPYDSDDGRTVAAALTAVMHNTAYATSGDLAARVGPFAGFAENTGPMRNVLAMHRAAVDDIDVDAVPARLTAMVSGLVDVARTAGDAALVACDAVGVRNAQATVLAPTGTIGLAMDCDTTGIEPDLGLVKMKNLVGGGTMRIVNHTVPRALANLGYTAAQVDEIVAYIDANSSIIGAPHVAAEHLPVFACAMGDNIIGPLGHIAMMAAVQPFLSGAISKTVNMPETATADDIADIYAEAWKRGVKAVAIYRDNCKVGQPLEVAGSEKAAAEAEPVVVEKVVERIVEVAKPVRERLPRRRHSVTTKFDVGGCEGYLTVGEYDDGRPGELFIKVSKQGTTLSGIMDAFAVETSMALQYGVPLREMVAKFTGMQFEPAGMVIGDPDVKMSKSILDYVFRRLALDYLPEAERQELGIYSIAERMADVDAHAAPAAPVTEASVADSHDHGTEARAYHPDAPLCMTCGVTMVRAGACHVCPSCGGSSGCS